MKAKTDDVFKGMLFAGCSFTWGQGLYYYSNMATLKEPPPDAYDSRLVKNAHTEFRKTLYYPRLVANHFNTFEISMLQNGGSEETSFDYIRTSLNFEKNNNEHLIINRYSINEIEYIIFQTSQPQRNTYYYDYVNPNASVDTLEFRTFSPETHERFYRYLVEQKKSTIDDWYSEHSKDWFTKIKENLQFYESKGIKTLVLNWEVDYMPYYKNDKWMSDRLITFEYNGKRYDTIREMMDKNKHLTINSDYENFEVTPKDHHPSKECHRVMANAVIKKIEETKIKNIRYEAKLI